MAGTGGNLSDAGELGNVDELGVLLSLGEQCGLAISAEAAHTAWQTACASFPGPSIETWPERWQCAGHCLGLRLSPALLTPRAAARAAGVESPVATLGPRGPTVLMGTRGDQVDTLDIAAGNIKRRVLLGALAQELGLKSPDDLSRFVFVDRATPCGDVAPLASDPHDHSAAGGAKVAPLARLRGFLRPERRDMQMVLLFAVVVGLLSLATPVAVEALVSTVVYTNQVQPLLVLTLVLFVCLGFVALLRTLEAWVVEVLQRRLFVRLVAELTHRLPRVLHREFDQPWGPELVNRFLEVVTLQKVVASLLIDGVDVVVQLLISMVVLGLYHPWLLGFDLGLMLLVGFVVLGLGRGGARTAMHESHAKYAVAAWLQELVRHRITFKSEGAAQWAWERADRLATEYVRARVAHFRILFRQIACTLALQAVAATVLLSMGGWLVMDFQLSLGQLVAAELMVSVVISSFTKLGKHLEGWYDLLASTSKIGLLLDLTLEPTGGEAQTPADGRAELLASNLAFGYEPGSRVFDELNLHVRPGSSLAVLGTPASGKSTLADLMFRLREPTQGRLELDGKDLATWPLDQVRRHVALVRHAEVLADTVAANVAIGRHALSPSIVRGALACAALTENLVERPTGLATVLGASGAPFSESQLRQLTLARALAGQPRLLVVDGLLDGIEPRLAGQILENLLRPESPWTLVLITSHPSLASRCEQRIELPGGKRNAA